MKKERADRLVVDRGLAGSQQKAQALIMAGMVYADGRQVAKAGQLVDPNLELVLKDKLPYVSRGGKKLEEALEAFDVSVEGSVAADLGASTGGFTDCLLQRGAKKVYAVDVDTQQLDWNLRHDSRVVLVKKNARDLHREDFDEAPEIVVMDLAFISVLKVLPAVAAFLGPGKLLTLIKPQFEAGRRQVGRKGVVRDPALHERILARVAARARETGFFVSGVMKPSVKGQKGNQEFFFLWSLFHEPWDAEQVKHRIKEVVWDEKD